MKSKIHNTNNYSANRTLEIIIWLAGIALIFFVFSLKSASAYTLTTEETYIDDIPFDTGLVVDKITLAKFEMEEESYIDDIPFNTAKVVANYQYKKAVEVVFELNEEGYIDDIPFATSEIAQGLNHENHDKNQSLTANSNTK